MKVQKKTDYPELENKEIVFIATDGEVVPAIVVGCNIDIGLTVVAKNDKDRYLICSIGPSSPLWHSKLNKSRSMEAIKYYISCIHTGTIVAGECNKCIGGYSQPSYLQPSSDTCSYSQ